MEGNGEGSNAMGERVAELCAKVLKKLPLSCLNLF